MSTYNPSRSIGFSTNSSRILDGSLFLQITHALSSFPVYIADDLGACPVVLVGHRVEMLMYIFSSQTNWNSPPPLPRHFDSIHTRVRLLKNIQLFFFHARCAPKIDILKQDEMRENKIKLFAFSLKTLNKWLRWCHHHVFLLSNLNIDNLISMNEWKKWNCFPFFCLYFSVPLVRSLTPLSTTWSLKRKRTQNHVCTFVVLKNSQHFSHHKKVDCLMIVWWNSNMSTPFLNTSPVMLYRFFKTIWFTYSLSVCVCVYACVCVCARYGAVYARIEKYWRVRLIDEVIYAKLFLCWYLYNFFSSPYVCSTSHYLRKIPKTSQYCTCINSLSFIGSSPSYPLLDDLTYLIKLSTHLTFPSKPFHLDKVPDQTILPPKSWSNWLGFFFLSFLEILSLSLLIYPTVFANSRCVLQRDLSVQ